MNQEVPNFVFNILAFCGTFGYLVLGLFLADHIEIKKHGLVNNSVLDRPFLLLFIAWPIMFPIEMFWTRQKRLQVEAAQKMRSDIIKIVIKFSVQSTQKARDWQANPGSNISANSQDATEWAYAAGQIHQQICDQTSGPER